MVKHANNSRLAHVANAANKARIRNVRLFRVFALVVVIVVAFGAGFLVRGDASLLSKLGFESFAGPTGSGSQGSAADEYNTLEARIGEIERLLADDSLEVYDLDVATQNVLEAISAATDDPYLRYYTPEQAAALSKEASSNYTGVGVLFSEYNGRTYAVDVFEGSAAQAEGVQDGDFVVAIDGDRSHDWSMSEVTSALKRRDGEDVVITWRRPSGLDDEGGREFTTTLTVSNYTVKNVSYEMVGSVGFIKLRQITQNSAKLVEQAIEKLNDEGAEAFVLDIRDNPGGYLTQAVDVASLFVRSGTIVRIQTKDADETTKNATGTAGSVVTDKPLVVLVNGNTAASAEVLAAALRDNQRATLVGVNTLGKGSVQVMRDLDFGGALRYTAAFYKSPNGSEIDGVGVQPDIAVSLSEDGDNQKALAIETALTLASEE